mmetsp:Transcript_8072/g.10344  ORF Transcript_8072/g.10344 Transcript_8072/m.10344 type:complete len:405 (+) Transcript_8072:155-1369(+)|eukprot:CAMPEP_0116066548 /NCGR_PEP_ID=MMETSP0322-20121206/10444_1 /TAXON_ID=163516 /ORGANISM="Leptocylindrus danicus var. apora, Strain B651" /LENGTH=404 /DNA_ID=CAMNT_0003553115 /DNA_START=128 /DNA_END=1342 /DNA_ORIENTATION=-
MKIHSIALLSLITTQPGTSSFLVPQQHHTLPHSFGSGLRSALFEEQSTTSEKVSEYYGKVLESSEDLKTNACTTAGKPPSHIQECLNNIHQEVKAKYYGCGLCIPDLLEGCTVLDLGCGSGRDVYIAAQMVGEQGTVIGVDMTEEQIGVAMKHEKSQAEAFGYEKPNTVFYKGQIEKLLELPIEKNSVDVIVSNCVINLCQDKEAVLKGCYELLKPGGELYFSDVYANRRISKGLQEDAVLWGECISGALYWNDFENLAKKCGFLDPRLVEDSVITVNNEELEEKVDAENLEFFSATYRLWKIDSLESHCEDYGQAVIYKGSVPRSPASLKLDNHHDMEAGKIFPVCGNTWKMLHDTRFKDHFDFIGNFERHYGIFEGCGSIIPFDSAVNGVSTKGGDSGGGCC